jgi:hypothetical protein
MPFAAAFGEFLVRTIGGHYTGHSTEISASPGGIITDVGNGSSIASIATGFLTHHGRFLSAQPATSGWSLVGDRTQHLTWETFYLTQAAMGKVMIKTFHDRYISAQPSGQVICDRTEAKEWEMWEVIDLGASKIGLRSFHGKYLSAKDGSAGWTVTADSSSLLADEIFEYVETPASTLVDIVNPWPNGVPTGVIALII